jgi:hypothetical protein
MPVPPDPLRGLGQLLDLCGGQELPAPALGVRALAGRFGQTFPKTSIEGLEGDLDNPPVFDRPRTRTFP